MAWHPFRNLGLKCVAVALGAMLWLTFGGDHVVERSVRVPLVFLNVPDSLGLAPDAPDSADVHLRGRASELGGDQSGVTVFIDLADGRAGSSLFHLRTDQVTAPFGVEVTQVYPSSVMLTLEARGTKTVPVEPTVAGIPAEGYEIGRVVVEPANVEVVGPESQLKGLRAAVTETVRIDGASAKVSRMVSIGVVNSALRLKEPRTARVIVEILRKQQ